MSTIKIGIVDDHTLFRNGLVSLLAEFNELSFVLQANNGQHMLAQLANSVLPDIILMDINMPIMDGREATLLLKQQYPSIKILALSMLNDEKEVIAMLRNGACGYMLKESDPKRLLMAIKGVYADGIYLNELVSGKLLHQVITHQTTLQFSERELTFLQYCCSEYTYKEIADQMCVSVRTIDNYRDALFNKLNLKSRTGLVLYAIRNNYVKI